ncbi:hypothetical protein Scep_029381 [Stephania cephalantha]|uniref:Uncharacterized protein n=1 Tax=Stephania cephalantha TaxID=152367 RepID=A0AAP0E0J0_9MAGN
MVDQRFRICHMGLKYSSLLVWDFIMKVKQKDLAVTLILQSTPNPSNPRNSSTTGTLISYTPQPHQALKSPQNKPHENVPALTTSSANTRNSTPPASSKSLTL